MKDIYCTKETKICDKCNKELRLWEFSILDKDKKICHDCFLRDVVFKSE